eukprot:scaffold1494_cov290-Chaetoceros_neogracile.AAC.7
MVNATKVGLSGPSTALNPAQPKDKALSIICRAQHDEERSPRRDHHANRLAGLDVGAADEGGGH